MLKISSDDLAIFLDGQTLAEYVRFMGQTGEWCDELFIRAAAEMLEVTITQISFVDNEWYQTTYNDGLRRVTLGNRDNTHFYGSVPMTNSLDPLDLGLSMCSSGCRMDDAKHYGPKFRFEENETPKSNFCFTKMSSDELKNLTIEAAQLLSAKESKDELTLVIDLLRQTNTSFEVYNILINRHALTIFI